LRCKRLDVADKADQISTVSREDDTRSATVFSR
jgi:hypothetical protein